MPDPSVLIVGAGPVGLVLAVDLARRGVPIRIIDTLAAPTTQSRAIVVHARSLDMMDALGVIEPLIASGQKTTAVEIHADGKRLARIQLDTVDSRYPFTIATAQTETERILGERLRGLGVVIERGVTLESLEQDATGTRACVRHAGGGVEVIAAAYTVGCDGAHSTVRGQIGETLHGSFAGEHFLMGDVEATCDVDRGTLYMHFAAHAGPGMVFPMRGNRMRIIAQITDPADTKREATSAWLQQVCDARGLGVQITEAHWLTTFEIHHAQVPRYRVGRVFLAGDAAHVHSPAGGQGMNTGMQDAFNLGWKLARATQRGHAASEHLLDSYHGERHPIAAHVIAVTTLLTHAGTLTSGVARGIRNWLVEHGAHLAAVQRRIANEAEEVTVHYRGSALVHAGHRGAVHAGDAAPDLATLDRAHPRHTVLVVPGRDGAPVACPELPAEVRVTTADPARYGSPTHACLVVVRPDGYIAMFADAEPHGVAEIRAYLEQL